MLEGGWPSSSILKPREELRRGVTGGGGVRCDASAGGKGGETRIQSRSCRDLNPSGDLRIGLSLGEREWRVAKGMGEELGVMLMGMDGPELKGSDGSGLGD